MDSRRNSVVKRTLPDIAASPKKLPYLAALRPRQWTKNLIVFAGPLFAFSINLRSLQGEFTGICLVLLCFE